ncbi:MAG: CocE/NonD family hydrolase, partial [Victivallales bacterium]|nr:CocE/NonD family hydrolase [Victivallales bacterium]
DGSLTTDAPGALDAATTFLFDPNNPVPTIGGNLSAMPLPPGGFDQCGDKRFPYSTPGLPLSARADVLCFQTEPLTEDVEISGPVHARLFVSSTALDTDFTAKLLAVVPPSPACPAGAAINLTDSIGRLRFRDGYEVEKLGTPGQVYELTFELYPTACRFAKGQRIRVDISSSNYPRFDVNPNTGGNFARERVRRTAENTLHHSSQRPSCIILPVQGD